MEWPVIQSIQRDCEGNTREDKRSCHDHLCVCKRRCRGTPEVQVNMEGRRHRGGTKYLCDQLMRVEFMRAVNGQIQFRDEGTQAADNEPVKLGVRTATSHSGRLLSPR